MKSITHKIKYMAALALLIWSICLCNVYDKKTAPSNRGAMRYLPSGSFLKCLALGYDEAMADFLWIQTVIRLGEEEKDYRGDPWLSYLIHMSTVLDPKFLAPYEFGGLMLTSTAGRPDEAIALLKRGIENVPRNNPRYWLQPLYLGYNYLIYKNDRIKAAESLALAASFPQSPGYLPLLIASLYAEAEKPDTGLVFINEILKNAGNKYLRNSLEKRAGELIVTKHILFLEQAVAAFIKKNKRSPLNLNELVAQKIIGGIPKEPLGGTYYLTKEGKILSSTSGGKLKRFKTKS